MRINEGAISWPSNEMVIYLNWRIDGSTFYVVVVYFCHFLNAPIDWNKYLFLPLSHLGGKKLLISANCLSDQITLKRGS